MKQELEARYPAPSDVVLKMFEDPAFHMKKMVTLGVEKYRVIPLEAKGDEFSLRIERKVPLNLPGFKGIEASVTHVERWNRRKKSGVVTVETRGVPVKIGCEATFADDRDGCVITYRWNVESPVPIVGRQIEKQVVADLASRADDERKAGVAQIGNYRPG